MKLNDIEMTTHPSLALHKKSYYHICNKKIDVATKLLMSIICVPNGCLNDMSIYKSFVYITQI